MSSCRSCFIMVCHTQRRWSQAQLACHVVNADTLHSCGYFWHSKFSANRDQSSLLLPPSSPLCRAGAAGTGQELHDVMLQASVCTGHCACLIPGSGDDVQSIALLAGPNGEHQHNELLPADLPALLNLFSES